MLGIYSFIMATIFTRLNAVDVAFTEASVGAGITSVLMIAALSRTKRYEHHYTKPNKEERPSALFLKIMSLFLVIVTGAVLVYGTIDMPEFGDPEAPTNQHVSPRYIEETHHDTSGINNIVTAILASYRGYDTLGETTVIFTAGICVILLLRRSKKDKILP